jgi:ParB family transcriptional regulator, chromosome partitioning protein
MKTRYNIADKTKAFDDLFRSSTPESVSADDVFDADIDLLHPFPNHPFKLYEGEKLDKMVESIKQFGVITPVIVKPANDGYTIISGHNRTNAAKIAGLKTIKAVKIDADEDEAAMLVVESNFRQRDSMKHSEKALAYKMKYDVIKRRGKRTDLDDNDNFSGPTRDIIGKEFGENGKQVQRYLRIAVLIPRLLALLDFSRIGLIQAVELSYLQEFEQQLVASYIEGNSCYKLSLEHTKKLRSLSSEGKLDADLIKTVFSEQEKTVSVLRMKTDDLKKYLPMEVTSENELLEFIRNALEYYVKNKQK